MKEEILYMIKELGLLTSIFIITIIIIIYMIKKEEKRQILNDKRYDELTNRFVTTVTKISDDNNRALKELSNSIHSFTNQFNIQQKK